MCTSRGPRTRLWSVVGIIVLIVASMVSPPPSRAYNESPGETHTWLARKSLEYLAQRRPDLALAFPLIEYRDAIDKGIWYADNSNELVCKWSVATGWKTYACDAMHHYASVAKIDSFGSTNIGHPGSFAAPEYAQALFDIGIQFWPAGEKPSLAALAKRNAGYIRNAATIDFKVYSGPQGKDIIDDEGTREYFLGDTYLGGVPYCDLAYNPIVRFDTRDFSLPGASGTAMIPVTAVSSKCPRWPNWAATDAPGKVANESTDASLEYLGWSLHLVQDLTVPYHAANSAVEDHATYETTADQRTSSGYYNHLPLAYGEKYKYEGQTKVDIPTSFRQCSDGAATCTSYVYIGPKELANSAAQYGRQHTTMERQMDAAIKLGAALLESYFDHVPRGTLPSTSAQRTVRLYSQAAKGFISTAANLPNARLGLVSSARADDPRAQFLVQPSATGGSTSVYLINLDTKNYLVPGVYLDDYKKVSMAPATVLDGYGAYVSRLALTTPAGVGERYQFELVAAGADGYYLRHKTSGKFLMVTKERGGYALEFRGPITAGKESPYRFTLMP